MAFLKNLPVKLLGGRCVSYLILSYLILFYLILSYFILSYLILSYLILSYLLLSYLIFSYLILSYLKSASRSGRRWETARRKAILSPPPPHPRSLVLKCSSRLSKSILISFNKGKFKPPTIGDQLALKGQGLLCESGDGLL